MAIKTTEKLDRRARTKELREFHQEVFEKLGIPDAVYVPTLAYKPIGKDSKHIALFPSQLKMKQDLYLEFVSREMECEDVNRTLYKWKFNPFFADEYESIESELEGISERYLVPVAELSKVEIAVEESSKMKQLSFDGFDDIMDPDQDAPLDQMTIRDLAAIMLKQPVSRKKWLNDLIK
jgi:hypothetical protein